MKVNFKMLLRGALIGLSLLSIWFLTNSTINPNFTVSANRSGNECNESTRNDCDDMTEPTNTPRPTISPRPTDSPIPTRNPSPTPTDRCSGRDCNNDHMNQCHGSISCEGILFHMAHPHDGGTLQVKINDGNGFVVYAETNFSGDPNGPKTYEWTWAELGVTRPNGGVEVEIWVWDGISGQMRKVDGSTMPFCEVPTPTPTIPPIHPPEFPRCELLNPPGDWVTSSNGFHHIPGQEETIEGSDDVYQLENGNFVQCLCEKNTGQGTKTVWWKIGDLNLSWELIGSFLNNGWLLQNGGSWNLFNSDYLAQNSNYDCSGEPTPTPTITITPTPTQTPSVTPTPTPTTTPGDEPESRCVGLSVSPESGSAPLRVRFNGSGFDENGEIQRYRFDFGDNSNGQDQVVEQDDAEVYHTFNFDGTYIVGLHVKDSRGNWRNGEADCKKTVTVGEGDPEVLGITTLPKTGASGLIGFGLVSLGSLGAYLYRKTKLI